MQGNRYAHGRCWMVCIAALGILFTTGAVCHSGEKIEKFAADQVHKDSNGNVKAAGRFYVMPDKVRIEQPHSKGAGSVIMIFRKDLNVYRMLMPEKKIYIESPMDESKFEQAVKKIPSDVKEEDLGTEVVNGFKCHKKQVETTVEVFGRKMKSRSIVWISDRLDFPIRTQSEDGSVTEFSNIEPGGQPDALFEVPSGYQKTGNLFEALGKSMAGQEEDVEQEHKEEKGGKSGFQLPFKLPKSLKWPSGD